MNKDKTPFPSHLGDPFNESNSSNENADPLSSSWQPAGQASISIAPRWQLLTDQEKAEQDKVINKLESKLKQLNRKKNKPVSNYTNQIIPDVSHNFSSSDSEEEYEENENHIGDENEEGLPLLWKSRSFDVDQISRKTENQYNKRSWWLSFCFCC